MPDDKGAYRVFDRKKFVVIMAILVSVVAVSVWIGMGHLAEYERQLKELAAADPTEAAAALTQLLQTLAVVNGIMMSLLAIGVIWRAWRGWRTASMPPKGSWILEGQRTWTGAPAKRVAQFKIAVGLLLWGLAVVGSLILWSLGDTL